MAVLINLRNYICHNAVYLNHIRFNCSVISRSEIHNFGLVKHRQAKSTMALDFHGHGTCSSPCQTYSSMLRKSLFRTFSNSIDKNTPKFDPKQESRRQMLLLLTYLSGFIGACLLCAIGFHQYSVFTRRARGIEDLHIREYGRKARLFRYRGFVLPEFVINNVEGIHSFDVREDDVWVVSFPKAGTTWLQEIVYLIVSDGDFEKASEVNIEDRFPYFEYIYPGKKAISKMPSPRLIKSHLPLSLLPNQILQKIPKIIYIVRNPKDTVVSYYHFVAKFLKGVEWSFRGTLEQFCQLFVEDLVEYGPWWKHVREAWDRRDDENVLILFYEDLQMDLHKAVYQIAEFLGKPVKKTTVEAIVKHCSFDNMKNNRTVNYDWLKESEVASRDESFMRKGKVGDWKNYLSSDIIQKLDDVVATKLTPVGVPIRDSLSENE